jgi:AsmA protein
VDALDFSFDNEEYLKNKLIDAELLTQINTNSLTLLFRQNDLNINKLKLGFKGSLKFLSNGYDLDFEVSSGNIKAYSLVTALPPKYLQWLEHTEIRGDADLLFTLKGPYIASENKAPDLKFDMNIRKGYVSYNKATPASDIEFRFRTRLPSLNMDSLSIDLDTLSFRLDKETFAAQVHTLGFGYPYIKAALSADMDLGKLQQAVGFSGIDLKGALSLNLKADGYYLTDTLRKGADALRSIPPFELHAALRQGYFKMASLPQGISNIDFDIKAACKDGQYKHISVYLDGLKAAAMNNFIKGQAHIENLEDYQMAAELSSNINLAELKTFIPMDSLSLSGVLQASVLMKGKYVPKRKLYPVINLDMDLQNGSVLTKYYSHPITDIQVKLGIANSSGSLKDMLLRVEPISFVFEGKPFRIQAVFKNFQDIQYNINTKGELDIAKIYSVFSQQDLRVGGFAKMDLSLAGRQSDATKGLYNKLHNAGSLQLQDLEIRHSKYFPEAFIIKKGLFSFTNDKMNFRHFHARYGRSDFKLSGYLNNFINYILSDKEVLKGAFQLNSNYILVDQFMSESPAVAEGTVPPAADTSGVVVIPRTLSVSLDAKAKKIDYNGLHILNFTGQAVLDSGKLKLTQTGFSTAGMNVSMNAVYENIRTVAARFNFSVKAENFDVRRAYNEVKLFHDMAPAAGKAQGIISLDYSLKGRLGKDMMPVYPSLEGGGVLAVSNVKFAGFKLLNNVSKESGKDDIKDPNVKNVKLKTTIKNNVIKLEKVKIKMAGFRLRIEGQSTFDKQLNFRMRLGLPPLGIIGIPMTVTGNSENPKVKIGKQEEAALPQTEDDYEGD